MCNFELLCESHHSLMSFERNTYLIITQTYLFKKVHKVDLKLSKHVSMSISRLPQITTLLTFGISSRCGSLFSGGGGSLLSRVCYFRGAKSVV